MGRVGEEQQSSQQTPDEDLYSHHDYDQAQETQPETYYAAENDQPEVTNFHYEESAPPPPQTQQRAAPPPPQPVQFPPPSPQPQPQAFPPQQGQPQAYPPHQGKPQAYPPHQGKPQAYPPHQGQPQAYPQSFGQPQAFPPQQYGQPQAFPPQQGQPQAFPPQQGQPQAFPPRQGQPQAYPPQQHWQQEAHGGMGYQGPGTPAKPVTPTGFPLAQAAGTDGWSSDLFDCMDDPENAIITACFPCVTYGQIAEIVDNGQSSCATSGFLYGLIAVLIGCPCIISCSLRTKLRARYGLLETPAPDWITHCFCEWCALCQEYRELNKRGLDPAIGWHGNVMKQQNVQMQHSAMAPPMNQRMM